MRLLLATRNTGKLRELQTLLSGLPLQCTSLVELGLDLEIPETGQTFHENAILKARGYAQASGLITLADDSGLEVDALGGAPGVLSSRWVGPGATDRDRILALLGRLRDVPAGRRQARFRSVAAVATPDGQLFTTEGSVEGLVVDEPRGEHGFGYDPIFYIPGLGMTMAQLDLETKNCVSHRARAVLAARQILAQLAAEDKEGEHAV